MASSQLLASKIVIEEEEPRIRQLAGVSTNILGAAGVTEKGPFSATLVTSFEEFLRVFGGYVPGSDLPQAIEGFFANGGQQVYIGRIVHWSDPLNPSSKTSATGSTMLQTAAGAPTSAVVNGSVTGPFLLVPGDTLIVDHDAIGATTATFNATAGARENTPAETYALSNGQTLTVSIDGGPVQTITFLTAEFVAIGAATAEEVAAVVNAKLTGGRATVTSGGTKVTITSDVLGTSSGVNVTGGTANGALGFTTGNVAGTGNVANIAAVTVAEVKAVVEAAVTGVTVSDNAGRVRITRNTTGPTSEIQITAPSTMDTKLGFDNALYTGTNGAAVNTLQVLGKYDGAYANSLRVRVDAATSGASDEFNLSVIRDGLIVEVFPNLSMLDTAANYVETVVNSASDYVRVVDQDAVSPTATATQQRPANALSALFTGGNDGLSGLVDADFVGGSSVSGKTGLRVFDAVQDLNLLIVPGRATAVVQNAMITYCEVTRAKQVFAILDSPAGNTAQQVVTYVDVTAQLRELSEFAAFYWPRLRILNPAKTVFGNDATLVCPPSGHIAGVYARTDASRQGGVYVPPAGIENGILRGCVGFETNEVLEEAARDLVFPKRINPLTSLPGAPRHIDGARTLKSTSNFPTVAERRGAIFIEQSVKNGLQFARHRNNNEELREQVSRAVNLFLLAQMNVGAFRTRNPATAFFVDFGAGLNPPSVQFAGKLIGRIGLATNKPAEFIILRFSQDTRALDEELAAIG